MSCRNRTEHSWCRWNQTSDTFFESTGFRYETHCQMSNCAACRYTEDLQPIGSQREITNWVDYLWGIK